MRKRFLSILLTLCMLLCLAPTAAFAEGGSGHVHLVCGTTCSQVGTSSAHADTTWTEWTATDSLPDASGDYCLTQDVIISKKWTPKSDTQLCLNGHSIIANGDFGVISVRDGCQFTLTDCAETQGKITHTKGAKGRGVEVTSSGEFTMFGGEISENCADFGGGVFVGPSGSQNMFGGNFTMEGGSIVSCTANRGGGVFVEGSDEMLRSGSFTMAGHSSIVNCTATEGGGLYNSGYSTFGDNSSIVGCTANRGGGVYSSGILKMYDQSSISDCTANKMPNAIHADGTFTNNTRTPIDKSLLTGINAGHAGTEADPILIASVAGLNDFCKRVNNGETTLCAKLTCDIILNDGAFDENGTYTENGAAATPTQWTPIGNKDTSYNGTFDGNGHTIKGLYVNVVASDDVAYAGLFGYAVNAAIQNVTVDGYVSVSGNASNEVTCVGGIVGCIYNTKLEGCTNLCTVKCTGSSAARGFYAGGIAGILGAPDSSISVTNCHNGGKVILMNGYSNSYVGGIAGKSSVRISNCYNTGAVTVEGIFTDNSGLTACFGGVVGYTEGFVSNCYNTGKVTSPAGNVGSVAGVNFSTVTNCYFLIDTASNGVGHTVTIDDNNPAKSDTRDKTKADFAGGDVQARLKQNDTSGAWGDNGYLAAAGMTLPLLKGQTADDHDHSYVQMHNDTEHWQECACGVETAKVAHSYSWKNNDTQHWRECTCGAIDGKAAHSFEETADAKYLKSAATCTAAAVYCKSCADCGVKGTDTFTSGNPMGHTGGTATCTKKAKCEVCGESYGDLNAKNHAALKHIDAKAATKAAEGNIEYWHCEDCGKYFADAAATKEIAQADTVIAKLPEEKPTSPKTGDTSDLALWLALLLVSGGAAAVVSRKRKHSR